MNTIIIDIIIYEDQIIILILISQFIVFKIGICSIIIPTYFIH